MVVDHWARFDVMALAASELQPVHLTLPDGRRYELAPEAIEERGADSLVWRGRRDRRLRDPLVYCPGDSVSRQQMTVFLLRAVEGSGYMPPPAIGLFDDVPANSAFAVWIEEIAERDITGGCSESPPLFCPGDPTNRAPMAVLLVAAFELPLPF